MLGKPLFLPVSGPSDAPKAKGSRTDARPQVASGSDPPR